MEEISQLDSGASIAGRSVLVKACEAFSWCASQPLVAAVKIIPVENASKIRAKAAISFFIVMSNPE